MKYKGSHCDFTEERNAELLKAYKTLISVRDNVSLSEIVDIISRSPSSRFWCSVKRASEVMSAIDKGSKLLTMIPTRRQMFLEIHRRLTIFRQDNPTLTTSEAIRLICNQEAPSFYLTPKSIIIILNKVRREDAKLRYDRLKSRSERFLSSASR